MSLTDLLYKAEKMAVDNSPSIMTGVGIVGTVTTAYLAAKAGYKAAEELRRPLETLSDITKYENGSDLKRDFQLTWKLYIPAAVSGALTIAAVVAAHKIGSRRAAAVAAAYTLSERAFAEYKEKVYEKLGEKKEQGLRDEIAQDRVSRNPVSTHEVVVTGAGEVLCHEELTGRYFLSDMETLRRAENDINKQILHHDYASLTEFFQKIGLPSTTYSEEVGWNSDRMLELQFSTTMSEDGRPCISVQYAYGPIREYFRRH